MTKKGLGPEGRRNSSSRKFHKKPMLSNLLIYCEGEKTEPNYFRSFRIAREVVGEGYNTLSLVKEAMDYAARKGGFDEIWCVFDRDSFEAPNFDNAIQNVEALAKKRTNIIKVAYSNEAFELRYLLHFEYQDTALSRTRYGERLTRHLGRDYKKNDTTMYATLQAKGGEALATRHAAALRITHLEGTPPHKRNPETTVDLLVKRLRDLQRKKTLLGQGG
ncbi:hypothetical protein LBMAG21_12390 [Armatimonadota bacterium]|nr:hypothetical protein LBMAG21_12390 [Armatimonadota bacterium]